MKKMTDPTIEDLDSIEKDNPSSGGEDLNSIEDIKKADLAPKMIVS